MGVGLQPRRGHDCIRYTEGAGRRDTSSLCQHHHLQRPSCATAQDLRACLGLPAARDPRACLGLPAAQDLRACLGLPAARDPRACSRAAEDWGTARQ